MTKSIFHQNAESYWNADLSVCPIIPGDKASIKGWNHYIDQIPSAKTRTAWMTDYANYGIGLLTGKRVGDKIIIGIDIDDDRYVEPVKRMFGGIVSGKRGQKGLTIFALAETTVKKTAIPSKGKRIIDILVRSLCVLPPTLHPEIRQPYISLLSCWCAAQVFCPHAQRRSHHPSAWRGRGLDCKITICAVFSCS